MKQLFFSRFLTAILTVFPLLSLTAEVPSAAKWARVKEGMSKIDLIKLLGEPCKEGGEYLYFGPVLEESSLCPSPVSFFVTIHNGKVNYKRDPFEGDISPGGAPTKPLLWLPQNSARLTHGLPYIDLRWRPASGVIPMVYELEVEKKDGGQWRMYEKKQECSQPYYAIHHTGSGEFRWRVKARNTKGVGNWSPWATFSIVKNKE